MGKNRLLLLLICAMGSAVVITSAAFSFTSERPLNLLGASQDNVKKWQVLTPVDEAIEPVDSRDRALRESKSRRYNSPRSDRVLTNGPDGMIFGRIDEIPRPSAMPISQSVAVVLGAVVKAQPYLSEDKKVIYTEFTVRIDEVFKAELPNPVFAGSNITVTQEGGAIRRRNGSVLRYFVGGTSRLPEINGRYVLFVSFVHDRQDLAVLTGYELRDGKVTSLEEGAAGSQYANFDEATFLDIVRGAEVHRQGEDVKMSRE